MADTFADNIFKHFILKENFKILIQISLKFVTRGANDNKSALVWQVLVWCQTGDHYLGLALDILKVESWMQMGRTANIIIKYSIYVFASICKNMHILLMGRRYCERWLPEQMLTQFTDAYMQH